MLFGVLLRWKGKSHATSPSTGERAVSIEGRGDGRDTLGDEGANNPLPAFGNSQLKRRPWEIEAWVRPGLEAQLFLCEMERIFLVPDYQRAPKDKVSPDMVINDWGVFLTCYFFFLLSNV